MIYVITGRVGTGKRTLVEFLASHDIEVTPYINGETKPKSDSWYTTDPLGVEGIIREVPTEPLLVIYLNAEDKVRKKNFVARYDNEIQAHKDFADLSAEEDMFFTLFEAQSAQIPRPFVRYGDITNDGEDFMHAIMGIVLFKSRIDTLEHMLTTAMFDPALAEVCDIKAGTMTLIASDPDVDDTPEPLTPRQIAGLSIDRDDKYPAMAKLTNILFR